MPNITTRGTKGSALTYQQGDEQIAEVTRQLTSSTALTVTNNRELLICNGASITITLEAVATLALSLNQTDSVAERVGYHITIKNVNATDLTIATNGAETIDGSSANLTLSQYGAITLSYDTDNDEYIVHSAVIDGQPVSPTQATITNSNTIDLVDTDVALRVGAVDPDASQHIEVDAENIQSKSDATTAAALDINPSGGNLSLGARTGTGLTSIYHDGLIRNRTAGSGVFQLRSDGNTDAEIRELALTHQDGTIRGSVGYPDPDSNLGLFNRIESGLAYLNATTAGSAGVNCFVGDPDGSSTVFHQGASVLTTTLATAGGLLVNNQLTGAGFERVLTASDASASTSRNANSTTFNFLLADANNIVRIGSTGTVSATLKNFTNVAYPVGTIITVVKASTSGTTTIIPESPIVLSSAGGVTGNHTIQNTGTVKLVCTGFNEWFISGDT